MYPTLLLRDPSPIHEILDQLLDNYKFSVQLASKEHEDFRFKFEI